MPGRKTLTADGEALWLHGACGRELVALRLSPDMRDGTPFAYALPAGVGAADYRYTLEMALALLQEPAPATSTALARPSRSAMLHMRALQALDGADAGASHRAIARVLFGAERVDAEWEADSELRGQLRYLLKRARAFVDGGYRDLLQ